MAKLTIKQRNVIEYALRNLERARAYINSADIAIARKCTKATTTLHYTRADGATLYELNKQIGSDITGIDNGIHTLRSLLSVPTIDL